MVYNWGEPMVINATRVEFGNDGNGYTSGTQIARSAMVQYWDENTSRWVTITDMHRHAESPTEGNARWDPIGENGNFVNDRLTIGDTGDPNTAAANANIAWSTLRWNVAVFDEPVTTSMLRLRLTRRQNSGTNGIGVSEWEVFGLKAADYVSVPLADKDALLEAILAYEALDDEFFVELSPETLEYIQSAYDYAKVVFTDGEATQDTVDRAAEDLMFVIENPDAEFIAGTVAIDNLAPENGDVLTAAFEGETGDAELSYIWKADGEPIAGAAGATYTVATEDIGKVITVSVRAAGFLGEITSEPTAAVIKKVFTITYDSNGGSAVDPAVVVIEPGELLVKPEDPVRTGFRFLYWALDGAEFDFTTAPTSTMTLVAAWSDERFAVETDAHNIKAGDYVNVNTRFTLPQKSNAIVLDYTFDGAKLAYSGFETADGVSEIDFKFGEGWAKITLMAPSYNVESLGNLVLVTKAGAEIIREKLTVNAEAEYVTLGDDDVKTIQNSVASVSFTTTTGGGDTPGLEGDTNGDGVVDMIDLSNIIDWFGKDADDADWEDLYTYFDFNHNNEIDVFDVTYIALLVK
jgi:hypothetical protein